MIEKDRVGVGTCHPFATSPEACRATHALAVFTVGTDLNQRNAKLILFTEYDATSIRCEEKDSMEQCRVLPRKFIGGVTAGLAIGRKAQNHI